MTADRVRHDLLALAAELAGFCDMAIAGEGNVSGALGEERFFVKASGTSMAALESRHLVEVDARMLLAALEEGLELPDDEIETLLLGARTDPDALKPSVESLFHAWLLALEGVEFVGHAHPVAANALLCSPRAGLYAARRLFPDQVVYCGAESVLVPYVDPGLKLARTISESVESYRDRCGMVPKIILVRNHGVIALGRTASDVAAALKMAEKSARVFIDAAVLGGPVFMSAGQVARIDGRIDEHYRQRMLQAPS
jgi:rhamnose utilization protein RhaD (predicted bifunctional aldolase and dehydrogenase)